jgi:lipid-A-disaccharide synthase
MIPRKVMVIAGETSGDTLAAELVLALKATPEFQSAAVPSVFFGAGGAKLAEAGVELALDLTAHAVFGITDVLIHYWKFRGIFRQLLQLASERKPELIVLVDFSGFNRRFAAAIREMTRRQTKDSGWNPKIVQYVSPQVWASRPGRARQLERDFDLLLSLFPFEPDWYAKNAAKLRVEFVGHPIADRHSATAALRAGANPANSEISPATAKIVLLPGSRTRELEAHLPPMAEALKLIQPIQNCRARLVLPNERMATRARQILENCRNTPPVEVQLGGLGEALSGADLAIASSGTVTLECAFFGVPAVVVYKTSWITYEIGRRIIQVPHIAMPNLLAGAEIFPELIQHAVTPENIARESLALLTDPARRNRVRTQLRQVAQKFGAPGAAARAARAILNCP